MSYTYIKFENQTYGEKAVHLLARHSIKANLRRNPNPNHKQGCNFALFVQGNIWQAQEIIDRNGIRNLGIESYRERL